MDHSTDESSLDHFEKFENVYKGGQSMFVADDGVIYYTEKGFISNSDGPAVIYPNGRKEWYYAGYMHRVNGPAIIDPNFGRVWVQRGTIHRADGPAVIKNTGEYEWWVWGKQLKIVLD